MVLFQEIKLPKQNQRQIRRITPEIEARLLAGAANSRNPFMRPLIILALETGMRRGELLKLRHEDWDAHSGIVNINQTKNGKSRTVTASGRAADTLSKLASTNKEVLLPMTGNAVNLNFQRLKKKTHLGWSGFHDLRHACYHTIQLFLDCFM